jgi:hypothetical protein
MNNAGFPFPWWDKTLTIYNKYVDPFTQRTTWYRTVVENCFWKYDNTTYYVGKYSVKVSGISLETKHVICRIPKSDNFMYQREWRNLEDKDGYFTLATGDIIVLGEVDDVIDDYTAGKRSTDLVSKYKDELECVEIDSFVINIGTGMGFQHYRVIGE